MSRINLPDETLAKMWKEFEWDKIERKLLKLQKDLTIAIFDKRKKDVEKLQSKIVGTLEFKALAVHKVTEENRSGAGIDGVLWLSEIEKMQGALSLNAENYESKPLKRIIIKNI